jgi:mono/diheme cytochrome c family protein
MTSTPSPGLSSRRVRGLALAAACAALAGVAACRQDMHDGPRFKPLQENPFYEDGRASRPIPTGTVPRGFLKDDDVFYTGMQGGAPVERIPMPITAAVVQRGRERFNIYCSPCHGIAGDGDGMIVKRGYKRPTSYHDPRLRNEKAGYFFDVMTRGFGQMPDYAAQVSPKDRWAIVSYIRALQLSQHASVGDLTPQEKNRLEHPEAAAPAEGPGAEAGEGAPKHE